METIIKFSVEYPTKSLEIKCDELSALQFSQWVNVVSAFGLDTKDFTNVSVELDGVNDLMRVVICLEFQSVLERMGVDLSK